MAAGVERASRDVVVGPLACRIEDGALRWVRFRGVEVVRGVSCPIRDAGWGTAPHEAPRDSVVETEGSVVFERRFTAFDGALDGHLIYRVTDVGVEAEARLQARETVTTNRAGFTLLHPLRGVEGAALSIWSPSGALSETRWPQAISPGQPARDIARLRHSVRGVAVDIAFEGDVFEMEDQRNWTDASFKTYCRPLSLPFPYPITSDAPVRQRIAIALSGAPTDAESDATDPLEAATPEVMLAVEPGWDADVLPDVARLARGAAPADAAHHEIVVPEGRAVADHLRGLGLSPRRVTVLPAPYLKSFQPEGPWPDGPTPADCARVAAEVFPDAEVGVGVLTNFTELNRRRPEPGVGDFVTHATAANVHAADDASVLETLEALPSVFASAQALAAGRALRLGLVAIGSRSNPYGPGLTPNPEAAKLTLAAEDPRQREPFAAAFAVAAYAAAARAGVTSLALAAPAGRFGIGDDAGVWPIFHAVRALVALQGPPVAAAGHAVATATQRVTANPSLTPLPVRLEAARVLDGAQPDPDWLTRAPRGPVAALPPLSVSFEGEFP